MNGRRVCILRTKIQILHLYFPPCHHPMSDLEVRRDWRLLPDVREVGAVGEHQLGEHHVLHQRVEQEVDQPEETADHRAEQKAWKREREEKILLYILLTGVSQKSPERKMRHGSQNERINVTRQKIRGKMGHCKIGSGRARPIRHPVKD